MPSRTLPSALHCLFRLVFVCLSLIHSLFLLTIDLKAVLDYKIDPKVQFFIFSLLSLLLVTRTALVTLTASTVAIVAVTVILNEYTDFLRAALSV